MILKQNATEGCSSCASLAGLVSSFIACFILPVITPLPNRITTAELCIPACLASMQVALKFSVDSKEEDDVLVTSETGV